MDNNNEKVDNANVMVDEQVEKWSFNYNYDRNNENDSTFHIEHSVKTIVFPFIVVLVIAYARNSSSLSFRVKSLLFSYLSAYGYDFIVFGILLTPYL
jgi:hypothetical protein